MRVRPSLSLFVFFFFFISSEILETPKSTKLVSQITLHCDTEFPGRKSGADMAAHTWTFTHTHAHTLTMTGLTNG